MGRGSSKVGGGGSAGGGGAAQLSQNAYVEREMTQLIGDVAGSVRLSRDNMSYAVSRLDQLADPGDQLIEDTGNGQIAYHKTVNRGWVVYSQNMTYQRTNREIIQDIHDSSIVDGHKWIFKKG